MEEVSKLKTEQNDDFQVAGSGQLIHALMENDLVDEYRLMVYPVILGSGKRFFIANGGKKLSLEEIKLFSSGIILLRYLPGK